MSSRALPWRAGIVACVLALLAGACADEEPPLRIGVVVDCVGIFRSFGDAELSGAQLPLIERGASRRGRRAQDGITPVTVAGRSVELVTGCAEAAEFSAITTELRRMAELEKVDAVVAGSAGADEIVIRDVARGHPETVFLPAVHGPREATLRRPAANVFRFSGDHGQGVAGLATYAYRELGWRRAAIVLANWDAGWGSRDAFAAEFCALGGKIEQQLGLDFFDPAGRDVDRVRTDVDGVAVFGGSYFDASGFLKRLARRTDDPSRQIVAGPALMDEPTTLRATSRALAGVTGSSYAYPPRMRDYLRDYSRAFPGVPAQPREQRARDRLSRCGRGDIARPRARRRQLGSPARRASPASHQPARRTGTARQQRPGGDLHIPGTHRRPRRRGRAAHAHAGQSTARGRPVRGRTAGAVAVAQRRARRLQARTYCRG